MSLAAVADRYIDPYQIYLQESERYKIAQSLLKGNPGLAIPTLESCIPNFADALVLIGECHEQGLGVPKSAEKAYKCYVNAFLKGAPGAYYALGSCYLQGIGVELNPEKSFFWFKKGASLWCWKSLYQLGQCYEEGIGTESNQARALSCYRRAALKGCIPAVYRVALFYLKGDGGLQQDSQTALRLLKLAIQAGHPPSMTLLAKAYLANKEVGSLEEKEALELLIGAAKQGYQAAILQLNRCFPQFSLERMG